MTVIALTGMPGSGKSVVIDTLKNEGYESVYMGSVIKDEMEKQKITSSSQNVRNFATELRKKHGDDIVARRCLPELEEKLKLAEGKPVIIEDIKGIAEVDFFKNEFGDDFILIAIHTPPRLRYERSRNRDSEWDNKTISDYEEFRWRDRTEMAWGLSDAIALADHIVTNDSTEDDLIDKIKHIINK